MTTDDFQKRHDAYDTAAKAYVALRRARLFRDANGRTLYDKSEVLAYKLGQEYKKLRDALIAEEMERSLDNDTSRERQAIRTKVDRRIGFQAIEVLLQEDNKKG